MIDLAARLGRLWPASALLSWGLGWAALRLLGASPAGIAAFVGVGLVAALLHRRPWRRLCVALGPPLALAVLGLPLPPWAWLALALALLALYPWSLWRDAPLYLTPPEAFVGLELPLAAGARLLDAGSGSGAGLRAWRRAFPALELHGIEASWPLWLWSRWRCPWATLRRGDLWHQDWGGFQLVYLFQRPESMPAALAKARTELRPGAWLLSLDFPLPGVKPALERAVAPRHRLYLYPFESLN